MFEIFFWGKNKIWALEERGKRPGSFTVFVTRVCVFFFFLSKCLPDLPLALFPPRPGHSALLSVMHMAPYPVFQKAASSLVSLACPRTMVAFW